MKQASEIYKELGLYYRDTVGVAEKFTEDSSSGEVVPEQLLKGDTAIFRSVTPVETWKQKPILISINAIYLREGFYAPEGFPSLSTLCTKLFTDNFKLFSYSERTKYLQEVGQNPDFLCNSVSLLAKVDIMKMLIDGKYTAYAHDSDKPIRNVLDGYTSDDIVVLDQLDLIKLLISLYPTPVMPILIISCLKIRDYTAQSMIKNAVNKYSMPISLHIDSNYDLRQSRVSDEVLSAVDYVTYDHLRVDPKYFEIAKEMVRNAKRNKLQDWEKSLDLPEGFERHGAYTAHIDYSTVSYSKRLTSSKLKILDGNTEDRQETLRVTEYFKPKPFPVIDPGTYRLSVYEFDKDHSLFKSSSANDDFIEKSVPVVESLEQEYDKLYHSSPYYHLGTIKIASNHGRYPLPSLTSSDELIGLECSPETAHKIMYCAKENIYYLDISNASNNQVTVNFLVKTAAPDISDSLPVCTRHLDNLQFNPDGRLNDEALYGAQQLEKISLLTDYFKSFTGKALPTDGATSSKDLLNLIMKERAGVCRHRAQCFVAAADALGIRARLVCNDAHAFVEVYENSKWRTIDLGGAIHSTIEVKRYKELAPQISSSRQSEALRPDNPFMPRQSQASHGADIEQYVDSLLQEESSKGRKNILCIMDKKQIEGFYAEILKKNKNSYFISDLDDISLSNVSITDGSVNRIDSRLGKFLKKNSEDSRVLVIDWSKCKPQHIGYNSIIDAQRRIQDIALAENITVVSILEHGATMGEDFYSRHQSVNLVPKELAQKEQPTTALHPDKEIPFYDTDWKRYLYGRIKISAEGYVYQSSELLKHIEEGNRNISLRNAPWDDRDFRLAVRDIEERGVIYVNGTEHRCEGIRFIRDDTPYPLGGLQIRAFSPAEEYIVVNKVTFNSLFETYTVLTDGRLQMNDIKPTQKLLVTDNLEAGQWAKLAALGLEVAVGKGVESPFADMVSTESSSAAGVARGAGVAGAASATSPATSIFSDFTTSNAQAEIIVTNDLGLCKKTFEGKKIIYINQETKFSDLIEKINYDPATRTFSIKMSALGEALSSGEEVVLVGNSSRTLAKQLESLFVNKPYITINGHKQLFTGKITLLTEKAEGLDVVARKEITFSKDDVWTQIESENKGNDKIGTLRALTDSLLEQKPRLKAFSYTQISSMLKRMKEKPHSNPLKHILRLRKDYRELKPIIETLWMPHKAAEKTPKTRLQKVLSELSHSPYAFIAGSSGVGKSRFVQKELSGEYEVFEGMSNIAKFLEPSTATKPKLLFIDEANLTPSTASYEVFNGIFEGSRELLIDGKLVAIPEGHKILFAGNYGHFRGRTKIDLVEEHGSIITFKELSDETLKDKVIMPILSQLFPGSDLNQVADIILKAYHHINTLNPKFTEKHPLTARNLQMMALRCKTLHDNGITEPKQLASMAVYDEVSTMLDKDDRKTFRAWLEAEAGTSLIKETKGSLKEKVSSEASPVAKSRRNLIRLLENLFATRELKISDKTGSLATAGLNGFLIEGGSGIGKSYTTKQFLESKGFKDGSTHAEAEKKYYLITPTNYSSVKATLEKAFEEGAIVIIDEINTMPLEDILNPLLSGVNLEGKPAANKGFTVIATQNPISFGKRLAFSDALNNRFQKINLKNYSEEELVDILQPIAGGAEKSWVKCVAKNFTEAVEHSKRHSLPPPNLRHLQQFIRDRSVQAQMGVVQATEVVAPGVSPRTATTQREQRRS